MQHYQPQNDIDGEDGGHSSERQALQHAAARMGVITSFRCAVFLHQRAQETPDIQLLRSAAATCRPKHVRRLGRSRGVRARRHGSGAGLRSLSNCQSITEETEQKTYESDGKEMEQITFTIADDVVVLLLYEVMLNALVLIRQLNKCAFLLTIYVIILLIILIHVSKCRPIKMIMFLILYSYGKISSATPIGGMKAQLYPGGPRQDLSYRLYLYSYCCFEFWDESLG